LQLLKTTLQSFAQRSSSIIEKFMGRGRKENVEHSPFPFGFFPGNQLAGRFGRVGLTDS
jgi:hypothetical protein